MSKNNTYFLVTIRDNEKLTGETLTLKVGKIEDSKLGLSFICLSDFIFDEGSSVIVDPKADKIKQRYKETQGLHVSIYQVLSVEEVGADHQGLHFKKSKDNLIVLNPD